MEQPALKRHQSCTETALETNDGVNKQPNTDDNRSLIGYCWLIIELKSRFRLSIAVSTTPSILSLLELDSN